MQVSVEAFQQIRTITRPELIRALKRDGWTQVSRSGARIPFIKQMPNGETRRVVIHYHPKTPFPIGTLKDLIRDIGWSDVDLIDLKLIK